jgi:ribose transport system substrate-binding protein
MKKLKILTVVAIALAVSAESSVAKDKVTVAFIAKALESSFWVTATNGAKSASQSDPNITVVTDAGTSETAIEEQIAKVESMIVRHVDAIAIAPSAPDQLIPVLQKAVDSEIPVVLVDTNIPSFSGASAALH